MIAFFSGVSFMAFPPLRFPYPRRGHSPGLLVDWQVREIGCTDRGSVIHASTSHLMSQFIMTPDV